MNMYNTNYEVTKSHPLYRLIKTSPFYNTYGSLDLVKGNNNKKYLRMGYCGGANYFEITPEQEKAFYLLCDVKKLI